MTILEIYCDRCDAVAAAHAAIGGQRDAQRVRQLMPAYQQVLRDKYSWVQTKNGEDLCPECAQLARDNGEPRSGKNIIEGWAQIDGNVVAFGAAPDRLTIPGQGGWPYEDSILPPTTPPSIEDR